jgi:serine/threonine protein kinase
MNGDSAGWTEDVFPNLTDEAKRLILRMTNLDPTKRATMSEIVEDSYWVESFEVFSDLRYVGACLMCYLFPAAECCPAIMPGRESAPRWLSFRGSSKDVLEVLSGEVRPSDELVRRHHRAAPSM